MAKQGLELSNPLACKVNQRKLLESVLKPKLLVIGVSHSLYGKDVLAKSKTHFWHAIISSFNFRHLEILLLF